MCSWVAVEVKKHYGDRAEHYWIEYPGCHFYIKAPQDYVNDRGTRLLGVSVHLHPISEKEVLINCIETGGTFYMSPE